MELDTLPMMTLSRDVFPDLPTNMVPQPNLEAALRISASGTPDSTMTCASAPPALAFSRAASANEWVRSMSAWVSDPLGMTDRM